MPRGVHWRASSENTQLDHSQSHRGGNLVTNTVIQRDCMEQISVAFPLVDQSRDIGRLPSKRRSAKVLDGLTQQPDIHDSND